MSYNTSGSFPPQIAESSLPSTQFAPMLTDRHFVSNVTIQCSIKSNFQDSTTHKKLQQGSRVGAVLTRASLVLSGIKSTCCNTDSFQKKRTPSQRHIALTHVSLKHIGCPLHTLPIIKMGVTSITMNFHSPLVGLLLDFYAYI